MSPKWSSPKTGANSTHGEKDLDWKSRTQCWISVRGYYWNPIIFPKPQDKDRGGDCHLCGDGDLSLPLPLLSILATSSGHCNMQVPGPSKP